MAEVMETARRTSRKRKLVSYADETSSPVAGQLHKGLAPAMRKHSDAYPVVQNFPSYPAVQKPPSSTVNPEQSAGALDLTGDDEAEDPLTKPAKNMKKPAVRDEEKRLKRFRKKAPQSFAIYNNRATTQRMFALDRRRGISDDCPHSTANCPIESVDLAGSTGNVYTITVTHAPTCTCPNYIKGNPQCKHIVYVVSQVLKAPAHLQYQLAFLTSELREIFDNAGPLPTEVGDDSDKDGKRKAVEGDCPICCCDLDPDTEEVVWCKAACGNNLHKTCFDQWAATKQGGKVTCPYCRTQWQQGDMGSLKGIARTGPAGAEGYVNVAEQLGLSGRRDYSTYHSVWVHQQRRQGLIDDEEEWY